jgi:GT2 family glycosyltransferase
VLFLHNDTLLQSNSLRELYEFLESHEEAAGVEGRLMYADGRPQHACFRFPSALNVFAQLCLSRFVWDSPISGCYPEAAFQAETPVDFVSGVCCLMQRELLLQYQGLDCDYYWAGEMMDLCYRLRLGGWKLYYLPTRNAVLHYAGASSGQLFGSRQTGKELQRWKSRFLFIQKHYPVWKKLTIFPAVFCAFLVNAIFPALALLKAESRYEARQYLWEQWAIVCESVKLF